MNVNLKGLEKNIADQVVIELQRHFEKFPEIEKRIHEIYVINSKDNFYAQVSPAGDRIEINIKFNEVNEDDGQFKVTIPGLSAKVAHECGHLIEKCLVNSPFNFAPKCGEWLNARRQLWRQFRMELKETGKNNVSFYAMQEEEFIPEVYAQLTVYGVNYNQYTQQLQKMLDSAEFGQKMR